jgi:hypothetical protein
MVKSCETVVEVELLRSVLIRSHYQYYNENIKHYQYCIYSIDNFSIINTERNNRTMRVIPKYNNPNSVFDIYLPHFGRN